MSEALEEHNSSSSNGENSTTTTVLELPELNATVYIVGTAHVSTKSCAEVEEVIERTRPDSVVLELCAQRQALLVAKMEDLEDNGPTESIGYSVFKALTSGNYDKVPHILFSGMMKAAAKKLQVFPGGEFRAAFNKGREMGARIILGDRPATITLARIWAALTLWEKAKIVFSAVFLMDLKDLDAELVENIKQGDFLENAILEVSKDYPSLLVPIMHERDQFLAYTIKREVMTPILTPQLQNPEQTNSVVPKKKVVVAIVGLAHAKGIKENWNKEIDPLPLLHSPPINTRGTKLLILGLLLSGGLCIVGGVYLLTNLGRYLLSS